VILGTFFHLVSPLSIYAVKRLWIDYISSAGVNSIASSVAFFQKFSEPLFGSIQNHPLNNRVSGLNVLLAASGTHLFSHMSRFDPHSDKLRTGQRKNSDHFFTDSQQHFHMQGVVAAGYDSVKKNRSSMRQLSRAKNSENTPQKILGHCPLLSLLIKFEHTVSPARARLYIAGAKTDVPGRANTAGERCQSISRVLIMIIQKSLPPSLKKNLRK
jgi:hypothetical protein